MIYPKRIITGVSTTTSRFLAIDEDESNNLHQYYNNMERLREIISILGSIQIVAT